GDNRVSSYGKDNRDGLCRLSHCGYGPGSRGNDNAGLESDELCRDLSEPLGPTFRPTRFDCDRTTFNPTEFTEPLDKSVNPQLLSSCRGYAEQSTHPPS